MDPVLTSREARSIPLPRCRGGEAGGWGQCRGVLDVSLAGTALPGLLPRAPPPPLPLLTLVQLQCPPGLCICWWEEGRVPLCTIVPGTCCSHSRQAQRRIVGIARPSPGLALPSAGGHPSGGCGCTSAGQAVHSLGNRNWLPCPPLLCPFLLLPAPSFFPEIQSPAEMTGFICEGPSPYLNAASNKVRSLSVLRAEFQVAETAPE